jgi:hypothetical protein
MQVIQRHEGIPESRSTFGRSPMFFVYYDFIWLIVSVPILFSTVFRVALDGIIVFPTTTLCRNLEEVIWIMSGGYGRATDGLYDNESDSRLPE